MAILTGQFLLDFLGIVTALLAVGYAYFKWSYQYWRKRNVPCLEPSVPFGDFPSPFSKTAGFRSRMGEIYNIAKSKGWRYCGVYTIVKPSLVILDLELIKHVMAKDFSHFVDRGTFMNEKDDPLSAHLFSLGGKRWRNLRVKLTPTFTSGKLKVMFQTLVDCGLVMEEFIEKTIGAGGMNAVDIKEILSLFTTNVIGSCAFGLDCNTFEDPHSPFRYYSKKILSRTRLHTLLLNVAQSFPSVGKLLRVRFVPKDVGDFYTRIVEDTVNYRLTNNLTRKDLLQLLIDLKSERDDKTEADGSSLTMKEIVAQSFLFFFAGFETSSTTMTFALYELAKHQEIQEKVRDEIETVLAKHDNKMTYDSLSELKYMKQVIDETLRMYPPVPLVTRVCVSDYKVPNADVVVEKGTRVMIPIAALHYDKEYYDNPNVFDPERFNEENKKKIHQYTHIPFGEGPRICVGERFGIMQTKVGLACLLRRFKVTLNGKTQQPLKLSPRHFLPVVEGGIWLNMEKL